MHFRKLIVSASLVLPLTIAPLNRVRADGPSADAQPNASADAPATQPKSLAEIRTAVDADPSDAEVHAQQWAQALLDAGQNRDAAAAAYLLMSLKNDNEYRSGLMVVRGRGLLRGGNVADGIHTLLAAAKLYPEHSDQRSELGADMYETFLASSFSLAESGQPQSTLDFLELCQIGLLGSPERTDRVQTLQLRRVQCLLALGKSHEQEALAQAKVFYNVCSMTETARAMLLVSQILSHIDPKGDAANKFKQEQLAGAKNLALSLPSDVTAAAAPPETVLRDVHVDASPYESAIAACKGERYDLLVAKGNLLLLADRASDALTVFQTAYSIADPHNLAAAAEDVARALRAQDHTIARANAWVRAIRPKPVAIVASTAKYEPIIWDYSFHFPGDRWQYPEFDAGSWKSGPAPFGFGTSTDWAPPRTQWKTSDIWLRREFVMPTSVDPQSLRVFAEWDDDAEIYINGVRATALPGYVHKYTLSELDDSALKALKVGSKNLLAVHCHNVVNDQIIDVGIVSVNDRGGL